MIVSKLKLILTQHGGPPIEICEKLRDMFPEVGFSWFYDEPGMETAGYL